MNRIILSVLIALPLSLSSQQTLNGLDSSSATDTSEVEVFYIVEQMPEFPGGHEAMFRFIMENLEYPEMAKRTGIEGRVLAEFTVDTIGNLTDIGIIRSIGGGCEEETIRVLELMPPWKPGIQKGKAVSVKFHLPLSFRIPAEIKDE